MEEINEEQAAPAISNDIAFVTTASEKIKNEIAKVIVGQDSAIDLMLSALFIGGHILLEGVPGIAKTLTAKMLAKTISVDFSRIQFTPDLMPTDIVGTSVFNLKESEFKFRAGPVFSNIILIDEINRSPAKTQAALFELMEERQVSVDGITYPMEYPFMVLATQNPIEQEGTYPLPEAQLDRFMLYINIDYPSYEEELTIVQSTTGAAGEEPIPMLSADKILQYQAAIRTMPVSSHILEYAVKLARSTRPGTPESKPEITKWINWGAGPRASQYLVLAAKARAALDGRLTPSEEDIRAVALPVLTHRVLVSFAAEAEGIKPADIIQQLLS